MPPGFPDTCCGSIAGRPAIYADGKMSYIERGVPVTSLFVGWHGHGRTLAVVACSPPDYGQAGISAA